MNKNFNRKKQKMQNKDDFNCSITWSIKNTKLKKSPVLIYSEVDEYFAYEDVDELYISDFISCEMMYDKVVKNFNILESEKPYLAKLMYDFSVKDLDTFDESSDFSINLDKCMYDFSVKDLDTFDESSDFAKFLAKYNFELRFESDESLSRYLKYLNLKH